MFPILTQMMSKILLQLFLIVPLVYPIPAPAADEPFELQGLHTNLTLREALAHVEALGATCVAVRARKSVGGLKSQCSFPACDLEEDSETCASGKLKAATFEIAGQPILTLDFEAPTENSPLRSIALFYAGDVPTVMQRVLALYGEPKFDTASQLEISWTPSRRLMWQRGIQRATFITHPQMILLAADRPDYGGKM